MKLLVAILVSAAVASPSITFASGGHYAGGHGSSHKGGHYKNSRTGDHYERRR